MALEAVICPQDTFTYPSGGDWSYDSCFQEDDKPLLGYLDSNNKKQDLHANWDSSSSPSVMQLAKNWGQNYSPQACAEDPSLSARVFPSMELLAAATTTTATGSKRKRRRTKTSKNKEEIENQRRTHIAVERNRRKQMNEYIAILRSLIPPSFVQRGDQASIIGGSINFVKELEQFLQSMVAQKRNSQQPGDINGGSSPFSDFFTFPQYSTRSTQSNNFAAKNDSNMNESLADIEVSMAESHANIKILVKKRPRQLCKMVASFQNLRLCILHLNVTTIDQMALYSVSVMVEEGCLLNTVDKIAAEVHQILLNIQEEAAFC